MLTDQLSTEALGILLHAADAAAGARIARPWRLEVNGHLIDVYLNGAHALPDADPIVRAQRIATGAAIFNLRCAAAALGYGSWISIYPYPDDPGLAARIVVEPTGLPDRALQKLYGAILSRHLVRPPTDPDQACRRLLEHAAAIEDATLSWLPFSVRPLAVLRTDRDYPADQLRLGMALQRVLLTALKHDIHATSTNGVAGSAATDSANPAHTRPAGTGATPSINGSETGGQIMSTQPGPIVLGYDGSPGSRTALHWATAEAERELAPLRIIEAFELVIATRPSPGHVVPLEAVRTAREKGLVSVAEEIREEHPDLLVETSLVGGAAPKVLIEAAEDARLVVLGSRGLGGWSGLLVGSVAVQVTTHALCPVIVVPHDAQVHADESPTVVVGVDGSMASAKAIEFAFDHAEAMHGQLVALHAWTSPFITYANGDSMLQFDEEKIQDEAYLLVAESVAGAAADHPDVKWTTVLVNGSPAQALLRRSESADLIVVGSRGRGGFTGLLLGSVSQSVLHHTACPIAIVR